MFESRKNYLWYLNQGFPHGHIAGINMCWIERAVATLSHFEGAEENLADIIHEVRDEYEKSMRVVVLSYL